jgi:hypothetical protein
VIRGERFLGSELASSSLTVEDPCREWMILRTHCTPGRVTNSAVIRFIILIII